MTSKKLRHTWSKLAVLTGLFALTAALGMSSAECPAGGNDGLTGKFVGSARCAQCHTRVHLDWSETLHARAYDTLEAIGQETNDTCLACHTVGFGEEGGFVSRALTNDLAAVGCESCHGPGRDHVENVNDESLHPPKNLSADVCGRCHTGSRHPTFEEWSTAGHALVTEIPAEDFSIGILLNNCGKCHSGEFFYRALLNSETIADDAFLGVAREDLIAITCVVCHDPHRRTGNAAAPDEGRDFQLRFPEVANPTPTNTIDAATNGSRFNLCGQCHHSRGRTWQSTSRGPHASVQANIYTGEMPMPDTDGAVTPLVPSRISVHALAREQCATCHMFRQDFMDEFAPAIAGHTFAVNTGGCATSGCHPSAGQASAALTTLQTEIQGKLDDIRMRLGDASTWEYAATGGPMDQSTINDNIKKIRFLLKYVEGDGSLGVHNPDYIRDMLDLADDLLTTEGL